ncbi:MAG: histidine phosphatase family protein [Gammaproteobacteria bacterium]|nr:histidine phosphatase family protein [Gammaproteobacteria bacterium]
MISNQRELLILRHGKSDWSIPSDDYHRPLKQRGVKGSRVIGQWLKEENIVPDLILSSPATRASLTAHIVCHALHLDQRKKIVEQSDLYLASQDLLLRKLAQIDGDLQRIMLVGHNPGLEDLVNHLSSSPIKTVDGKILPTASLAHFALPRDWSELCRGCGTLLKLQRSRELVNE